MDNINNLELDGTIQRFNDNERVQFNSKEINQVTIRLPSSSFHSENLNSAISGCSQENIRCNCDGTSSSTTVNSSAGSECANGGLTRKIQNFPGASPGRVNERSVVTLTHLPRRPPIDIEFRDLVYVVSKGRYKGYKTILQLINGKFKSGELTAIMGPSGAGKSTLMNVLAGYKTTNLNGSILINGKARNLRRFRKMSCYIMQDDCLLPYLTVYESMMVSANLKLGKNMNAAAKKIVVEEILITLGLSDANNTQTQCLSGGQRKRLSIALELVNNPPVMFFDEPTSGLDSSSCFQCLNLLKSLSRGGRTIICTIHQPSARLFEMFDNLYLLVEGRCIYQGNIGGLVPFLASMGLECPRYHNPADYVMEVACGEHGEYVEKLVTAMNNGKCKYYKHNQAASMLNTPTSYATSLADSVEQIAGFPTNGWTQFWVLLKRKFLSQLRDMTLTRVRLISHIIVGLLIGALYYGIGDEGGEVSSNAGCIFFTVMFLMFSAMMPTILTFPTEMSVLVREHLNYWYSLKSFYFARMIADIPFQTLLSIIYATIVYFLTSQPLETYRFLMYLIICILTALVSQSIGLLIGAAMSVENGMFIGPVSSVPIVLFSGFFIKFSAMPSYLSWLSYVSFIRYGFEGAMLSIYGYNRSRLKCSYDYCHFRNPAKFLEEMAMLDAVYWIDIVALTGFLILLRFSTYFVLRLKLRSFR